MSRIFIGLAVYPTFVPYVALGSYLPPGGVRVELCLSSTWGRADQQTSQDSNRVWGVLFCARKSIPAFYRTLFLLSPDGKRSLPPSSSMVVDLWAPLLP